MADTVITDDALAPADDEPLEARQPEWWRIDSAQYEAQGRSFDAMVIARMCPTSRAQLGERHEVRVPVEDPSGAGVRFETRPSPAGEGPVQVIESCCSRTPEYRDPQLTLKEVLFRILLAGGNRPRTVEDVHEQALNWTGIGDGRVITEGVVRRLLERDPYYGFAPVEAPEGAP